MLATGVGGVDIASAEGAPGAPPVRPGAPHLVLPRGPAHLGASRIGAGFNPTVGRLEYDDPVTHEHGLCTGAVVRSNNRNLVLTAGHCMSEGGKSRKYQNFKFRPGATTNDPAPFGVFEGFRANSVKQWGKKGDLRYDFGFVNVKPNQQGQRLGDAVGENGIIVNQSYVAPRTVISYLGALLVQKECFGETRPFLPPPESRVRINCDLPPGSSGGPWLKDYDAGTHLGLANGVISRVAADRSYNLSPYFDDAIWAQYQRSATY
ncbi:MULTISPECIES: trypsin-like serine protease [unclassified Actinomadura]|uniref:trypsin-like serine peptidase n=1 Tax=unclassified Actinomadura TaxID=2626254 RepID=UPI00135A3E15|nr:trypsin-like serine protease [Actinomadura sp. K4S16]